MTVLWILLGVLAALLALSLLGSTLLMLLG